jgi:cytochrome b
MKNANSNKTLVWDLPTRLFHWLLAAAFIAAWLTHEDNRFLDIHVFAGYLFLGLLLFRLAWGVIGSHYARFHTFAHRWPTVWAYTRGLLTGEASRYLGHNPAGGWAIFLMLALGLLVSISGLLVLGGEEGHGVL